MMENPLAPHVTVEYLVGEASTSHCPAGMVSIILENETGNKKASFASVVNVESTKNLGANPNPALHFSFSKMEGERKVVKEKQQSLFNGMPSITFSKLEVDLLAKPF